jgi:hypothetical protein
LLKRAGLVAARVGGSRFVAPLRAAAQDATVKDDPAVKRGGTLRFGVNSAPVHGPALAAHRVREDLRRPAQRVRGQSPSTFFGIYDVVRCDTVSVAS